MQMIDDGIYKLIEAIDKYNCDLMLEHGPNYKPEVVVYLGNLEYGHLLHYASQQCVNSYSSTHEELLKTVINGAEIIPVIKSSHFHISHV